MAPLNRCAVQADAGESAASGRRARRAAELRCSGRGGALRRHCRLRRGAPERYARGPDREERLSRCYRRHGACNRRCAAPHSAAPLRSSARAAPAASGRPWPSPFSRSLCSPTLGSCLATACTRWRACSGICPAGTQRARWSCTPCAPAAPLSACSPHPRIARTVFALWIGSRARSRGTRRARYITRCYAQASCLCGAARGVLPRETPRSRNPTLCPMPASASLRLRRWPRFLRGMAWRPARAHARLRAIPGLPLRVACRCCARGHRRGSGKAVAARLAHRNTSICCSLLSSQRSAVLGASRVAMNVLAHALDAPARGAGGFPPTAINA